MVCTQFDGLKTALLRHVALVTWSTRFLGLFDGHAKAKPYTPFPQASPRLPGPDFC